MPKSGMNTEIVKSFRAAKILASKDEDISSNKIVRDFVVSTEEDLKVDFAWQNGKLNCAATLDLRHGANKGTAALKAIALDKAGDRAPQGAVYRIGLYAVSPSLESDYRPHIGLLRDYSDQAFNWDDPPQRIKFRRFMSDNLHVAFFDN